MQLIFPLNLLKENSRYGNTYCQIQIIETYGGTNSNDNNRDIKDVEGVTLSTDAISQKFSDSGFFSSGLSLRNYLNKGVTQPTSIIHLPMPLSISTNYGVTYDDFSYTDELTKVGSSITTSLIDVIATSKSKSGKTDKEQEKIKDKWMAGFKTAGNVAAAAKTLGFAAGGLAVNPHKELLFNGVKFREFKLKYKLIAKDSAESEIIKNIVEQFEYHMHPALNFKSFLYKYPSEFKISFKSGGKDIFKIYKCVLTSYNVSYGGNNFVTFKDTNRPVEIDIELDFKETNVLTKDFIERELR